MTRDDPGHPQLRMLAERGWLSLTSPAFRTAVLEKLSVHHFKGGDPVYRIDDRSGGLWAIMDGSIEAEMPGATGPSLGHFATPGFWFGEGTLIHPTPRRVGVFAIGPATLAHVSLADCQAILAADPSGWRWIALLSTFSTDLVLQLAADLLLRDPEKRTAALLLRLSGQRNGRFLKSHRMPVQLSHEKLGQMVNLSRNAIGPILASFAGRGFIAVRYRSIDVLDAPGLSDLLTRQD